MLIAVRYQNPAAIVGNVMRELTALEIERFDFTGHIPDMNMPVRRQSASAPAKKQQSKYSLKTNPFAKRGHKKRRPQIATARTA